MSSVTNGPTTTKVFTWASVTSGKKQAQVEVEDERAKEREKRSLKKLERIKINKKTG